MPHDDEFWGNVDNYFVDELINEDDGLRLARSASAETSMPHAEVAPSQGALLALLAQIAGARRVLEFGTLAGYSTIWFARAVGPKGRVLTLEVDERNAAVAQKNFERAGVSERIDLMVGPAMTSATALIEDDTEPFDFVFIDADKPNNPRYLTAALELSHSGTVIVVDNVVRKGAIIDSTSDDARVQGSRQLIHMLGSDDRLEATALQTVGAKGWDGFAIAVVK